MQEYTQGDECGEDSIGSLLTIATNVTYHCHVVESDTIIGIVKLDKCSYRIRVATSRPGACSCEGGHCWPAMADAASTGCCLVYMHPI